ncbi:hypothetical protein ACIBIZ_37940 [Nonomuraea spiralis]|uniref:hypothetical protein n=1 Tax=Nonomuraea spiralis TaxID=46182 RepID=UPI0037AAF068
MNDAGFDSSAGLRHSRAAWFQVSLPTPTVVNRPLPVQPFLACAKSVAARVGVLHLKAVQVLLPVQSLASPEGESQRTGAVVRLLQEIGRFADLPPQERTGVRVTLDGGQNPTIRSVAPPTPGSKPTATPSARTPTSPPPPLAERPTCHVAGEAIAQVTEVLAPRRRTH